MKRIGDRDSQLWDEVDDGGYLMGAHSLDWLTKLRGYFRNLDWSVDNFKLHPQALLMALKDKIVAEFEYRGGLGNVI